MAHYGAKEATSLTGGEKRVTSLGFQVSDFQTPITAVWRIADKSNLAQFGPRLEDKNIENLQTKKPAQMVLNGGTYVIEAEFMTSDTEGFGVATM